MHSRFGRVDALFVIAMKDQPLLRDLKMQFPKTATPMLKAAEILCRRHKRRLQCKQSCSRCDYDLALPKVGFAQDSCELA
jgi:hypothetical protein